MTYRLKSVRYVRRKQLKNLLLRSKDSISQNNGVSYLLNISQMLMHFSFWFDNYPTRSKPSFSGLTGFYNSIHNP